MSQCLRSDLIKSVTKTNSCSTFENLRRLLHVSWKEVNTFNAECFQFQSFHWQPFNDIYSYVWTDHKIKHKWQLREKSCLLIVFNDGDTTWPSNSPDLTEFMRSPLSFPSWWHFSAKSKRQKYQCWWPPIVYINFKYVLWSGTKCTYIDTRFTDNTHCVDANHHHFVSSWSRHVSAPQIPPEHQSK